MQHRFFNLCAGVLALVCAKAAHAQIPDDAVAIARGQRAVAWIQNYECPSPGRPLTVAGLGADTEIQRALTDNWSFIQNSVGARQQALHQRDSVAAQIQESGGRPTAGLQRSFADLDAALSVLEYRVATAEAQWALANYVVISRTPGDYNLFSGQPNPLGELVPVAQSLEGLSAQFGEPATQVFQRFRACWISANDVYLQSVASVMRERINQARTIADIDRLLSVIDAVPTNGELEGGRVVAEAQARRRDLVAEAERLAALEQARNDAAARARLEREANATLTLAARYVRLISRGGVDEASSLLASDIRLYSPNGSASGRSAVSQRMRSAASSGENATIEPPRVTSGFQVQSRIVSGRGSGVMSFRSANGLITVIELRQ